MNRQDENPSDSSDSEDEKEKHRPSAVKMNNNHKTVAMFDLWKTEGKETVQCECLFYSSKTLELVNYAHLTVLLISS